jgi:hypothetical protein
VWRKVDYLHTPANRQQMKYKPLLPPPAISPIATASEEQENNNDNQNKIHVLLQNMSRADCRPACGCGITTPLASEST